MSTDRRRTCLFLWQVIDYISEVRKLAFLYMDINIYLYEPISYFRSHVPSERSYHSLCISICVVFVVGVLSLQPRPASPFLLQDPDPSFVARSRTLPRHARFVRFVNMLINDGIYHTDDAIKFLSAIKVAQVMRQKVHMRLCPKLCIIYILLVCIYILKQ